MEETRKNINSDRKLYHYGCIFFIVFFNIFNVSTNNFSRGIEINLYSIFNLFYPPIMLGNMLAFTMKDKFSITMIKVLFLMILGLFIGVVSDYRSASFHEIYNLENILINSIIFYLSLGITLNYTKSRLVKMNR